MVSTIYVVLVFYFRRISVLPNEYHVSSSAQQRVRICNWYRRNIYVTALVTVILEVHSVHCAIQSDTTRFTTIGYMESPVTRNHVTKYPSHLRYEQWTQLHRNNAALRMLKNSSCCPSGWTLQLVPGTRCSWNCTILTCLRCRCGVIFDGQSCTFEKNDGGRESELSCSTGGLVTFLEWSQ